MPSAKKNAKTKTRTNKRNPPPSLYVRSVLMLYQQLPHTPSRPRPDDRFVVSRLERQKYPLLRVQAALLLGTARRIFSSDDAAPLMPIRSFRFFLPIIDELKYAHLDNGYVNYLARKLSDSFGKQLTLKLTDDTAQLPQRNRRSPRQLLLPW
jgi:hypothetical protein